MPIEKLRPSFAFNEDRINELKKIAPEAFADGKINWETLKEALGEYLEDDDERQEHFGLFWPGKRQARRMAAIPSKGTLVPVYGEGLKADGTTDGDGINNSRNIFIEGENLEVLKILQKAYAGKIKMIYIDPPYNTGNDFVYDDNFTEPLQEYLRRTGQVDEAGQPLTTNKRADGRFHSKWLSMMYPRLRLARNLLRDDGVIFVSIDENEVHNLKVIMNEIFGEENFVACIIWQKRVSPANDAKWFSGDHEYLVIYAKIKENWFPKRTERTKEHDKYYKNPDNDPRGPWNSAAYTCNKNRTERPNLYYSIVNPNTGEEIWPDENAVWAYSKEKHLENMKNNLLYWGKDGNSKSPRKKQFLDEAKNVVPRSVWLYSIVGSTQQATTETRDLFKGTSFIYPKPVKLLKKILWHSTNSDDIVLDFFAGSGTFAQAVLELNFEKKEMRKYILLQMRERIDEKDLAYKAGYKFISEISKARLNLISKKFEQLNKKDNASAFDHGFKNFIIEASNYKNWINYETTDSKKLETLFDQFETPLRENWTEQGLLTETILIEGFPLDSNIETLAQFKSNKIQKVSSEFCDHALLVCFDEKIHDATIGQLDLNEKDIFICLDSAISDQEKLRLADKGLIKTV